MLEWFTGTIAGKFISTFFISMLPVVELRLGLPYGIALGLDYPLALTAAVLGNMLPVPFIILFIRQIFAWMRRHMPKLDGFVAKIESKAHLKGETVQKYGPLGLLIFVAIPLPGTGAFEAAAAAGHTGEWDYVYGVLRRLAVRGIADLGDAEEYDMENGR